MGLRLPLDLLPWLAPEDRPELFERDPMERRDPLPAMIPVFARRTMGVSIAVPAHAQQVPTSGWPDGGSDQPLSPEEIDRSDAVVRTALCVEPREGRIHVFMPPVAHIEHYLELIAVVEEAAKALTIPVRIEGYAPPHDSRVDHFKVTPDPGVIEVNVQPSTHWDDLVTHPGTRHYEIFPINAYEAESRRVARFFATGAQTGIACSRDDRNAPTLPHDN